MEEHLIHNGQDPSFRVWRGLSSRNSLDEDWEEHFRVPTRHWTLELDFVVDMRTMVVDAFQQINDPVVLEVRVLDIVEEAFRIADGLQEGGKEGEPNGDVEVPFDNERQQPLGDAEFDFGDQKHNFDLVALDLM